MIYLLLLTLNVALLIVYLSDKRFWLVTIPIWLVLVSSFVIWRVYQDIQFTRLDTAYWKSAEDNSKIDADNWRGDDQIWKQLEDGKAFVKEYSVIFLNAIFLQTILTFTAQIIGYKFTMTKRTYQWTSLIFGILLLLNLLLMILLAIVPMGRFF